MPSPFCARFNDWCRLLVLTALPLATHYFPFSLTVSCHHCNPLSDSISRQSNEDLNFTFSLLDAVGSSTPTCAQPIDYTSYDDHGSHLIMAMFLIFDTENYTMSIVRSKVTRRIVIVCTKKQ
jgi:hypothetical protein